MMKRILSFLLCLIMVLGLTTPAVQASSSDDISSSDTILDSIYIPEGSNGNVVINGKDVTDEVKKNHFDELPNPSDLVTEPVVPTVPVDEDSCRCADLATAQEHPGICKVKAVYIELCNASEQVLYTRWASFTPAEQAFMRDYLCNQYPLKLVALDKMLAAPNGSAFETLSDGTTVRVEGIPEYSSLTVGEAADEVRDIVDAYVAQTAAASTELFSYDVSVQNAEGADWQPDTSVKMELELPGEKLHKYSKVYVVHVDDDGVATTIQAEVTEDGKIAFETPGFSTFTGFTVDFDYSGLQISIPGMSSIKLSELLDRLMMPLDADDVINVEYTDYTQLKIEQLEGDWLLTSLKAFTTDEKLTLIMSDGMSYEIKVTDEIVGQRADCHFANPDYTGNICFIDVTYGTESSHNGVLTLKVSDNTGYGVTTNDNKSSYYHDYNWWYYRVVFDGSGVNNNFSNGGFEVCIQKNGTGNDFKVPIVNWYIKDGATVNVYLEGFDSDDTISFESWIDGSPLFTVDDGALYFNVDDSVLPKDALTDTGNQFNFHSTACDYKEIIFDGYNNVENNEDAIIFVDVEADNLFVNDVKFINSPRRALYIQAKGMNTCRLDNCYFDSTIYSTNGGGGVIYVSEKYSTQIDDSWVNVDTFTLNSCVFDGNKAASTEKNADGTPKTVRGGAVLVWGDLNSTTFYDCDFIGTHPTAQGGAVSIGSKGNTHNMGNITFEQCTFDGTYSGASLAGGVLITQLADDLKFINCTFNNVTGAGHGGGIHIGGTQDAPIEFKSFTMTGCSFTNCAANDGRGGALRMYSAVASPVTITDCTFNGCQSKTLGGALSFQGAYGNVIISGTKADQSTFIDCRSTNDKGGAISLDAVLEKFEVKNSSFSNCKSLINRGGAIYHGGTTTDFDVTNCTFDACEAAIYGGAICLLGRTTTVDITGGSFTNCKAGQLQAIFERDSEGKVTTTPTTDKKGNPMFNGTGGGAAICIAQYHKSINIGGTSTKNQSYLNCETMNNGGAISFEGDCEVQFCNIEYVTIDGCKARDSGTAILMGDVTVVSMTLRHSTIKNCTYISGRTENPNENSIYDEDLDAGKDFNDIVKRSNDVCGTFRTIGTTKAQLTVESVTFSNNTSFTGGGGIYWNANRLNGYDDDKDGPYNFTNSLTIKDCTFTGNTALRDGGAIYVEASLTVEGSTFLNNVAERGGAIAQQLYNNGDRKVQPGETNNMIITPYVSGKTTKGTLFDQNYAKFHGGAISLLCNATNSIDTSADAPALEYPITCLITGAEIKNNSAGQNGGGVYFYQMSYPDDYAAGSADHSDLDNKEVEAYIKSLILDGSSIHSNYAGCGPDNLDPENSNAAGNGGGVYLKAKKNTTLNILGCDIYSNRANNGNGGGVFMTGLDGICTIGKSEMTVGLDGKARNTVIGGSAEKANVATTDDFTNQNSGNGGGVAIFGDARIEMHSGTVSFNSADTAGGGIAVHSKSSMWFDGGTVEGNTAYMGGGISLHEAEAYSTEDDGELLDRERYGMYLDGGTIKNNSAHPVTEGGNALGGGICVSTHSTMKINGGVVSGNMVISKDGKTYAENMEGGGIAVCQDSDMWITGGIIRDNRAYKGGGFVVRGNSDVIMNGSVVVVNGVVKEDMATGVIRDNYAHQDGGAVYLGVRYANNVNTFTMNNGWIYSNEAKNGAGGGVFVSTYNGFYLKGGNVEANECETTGGGIYSYQSVVEITNGVINNNKAKTGGGGGIYCNQGWLSLKGNASYYGSILNNMAPKGCGGGICMYKATELSVEYMKMEGNFGMYGGGIYTDRTASTNIKGGIFTKNYANQGAGLFIRAGQTTISGGSFTENVAGDPIKLDDGTFAYSADTNQYGGGILVDNLYASNSSWVKIEGGSISGNKAPYGGGMWIKRISTGNAPLNVTMTGGSITYNTAKDGGGVYVNDNNATSAARTTFIIKGGDISNNTANGRGGGVYADYRADVQILEDTTTMPQTHGSVNYNTAYSGGGVAVAHGATLTVTNGYITYNRAYVPSSVTGTAVTGYQKFEDLYGAGGGIFVACGNSDTQPSTFTLTGTQTDGVVADMAIYGNEADFCGDDVFSSGEKTLLDVPQVVRMNLVGYGFNAEGWFEDYNPNDANYTADAGLNMLKINDADASITVERYRNATAMQRKYAHIKSAHSNGNNYVEGTDGAGYNYVNKLNAFVAMTLGVPAAADDTIVVDYNAYIYMDLLANDLLIDPADFASTGILGQSRPTGIECKDGVYYSHGTAGSTTDYVGTFIGKRLTYDYLKIGWAQADNNGILFYTRTGHRGNLNFMQEDTMCYAVKHNNNWFYAMVNIIPATSIYFEDNASQIKYHTDQDSKEALATWVTDGKAADRSQDIDRPGVSVIKNLDADSIYGYDSHRSNTTTYSDGGVHYVTVSRHDVEDADGNGTCDHCSQSVVHSWVDANGDQTCDTCGNTGCRHGSCSDGNGDNLCDRCDREMDHVCIDRKAKKNYCDICGKAMGRHTINARASFTFTGTGFDIVSLCSKNTGIVSVSVYSGENINFDNPDYSRCVATYMVDTHYGYEYDSASEKWVLNENSTTALYQVPVIKADLTHVLTSITDDPDQEGYNPVYNYTDFGYGTYTVEIYVAPSFMEADPGYWSSDFYLDAIRIYNPAGKSGEESQMIQDAYRADGEGWPVYAELRNMFINQADLQVDGTEGVIFIDGMKNASVADYTAWGPNNEIYLNPNESVAFTMDMNNCINVAGIHLAMRGLTGKGRVLVQAGSGATNKTTVLSQSLSTTDMYYDISKKNSDGEFIIADDVVTITNNGDQPIAISNVKVTHTAEPQYKRSVPMFFANRRTAQIALEILSVEELIDPIVTPKRPALSFNGMVCYNVFFSAEALGELTADDLGLAVFSSEDTEGTIYTAREVIYGATEIDGLYMTATSGVHAKNLGDKQYFRAFARKDDGTFVYSKMVSYSAVDYAMNVLAKSDDVKLKQLVVAMLNYGAEAQKFFGYNTDDLMTKNLTADHQALLAGFDANSLKGTVKVDPSKVGAFAATGGFLKKSPAISFKGAFEINYFFTPANAVDGDMTLYFWSEDTYNSVDQLTVENADKAVAMLHENGIYSASSDEIAAKYLDKTVFVAAVYRHNGVTYCSGVLPYSIATYCQDPPATVQDLATAAAIYGCTAKQYFGV